MKVLIINTIEFSRINGITAVIMNYYRNMDKSNMQMDILALNEIEEEFQCEFQKHHSRVFVYERRKHPFRYCIQLEKLLKKQEYDVIHIHGNSAMMLPEVLIAKLAGVPIRIVHSHNTTCSHLFLHSLFYPVFKRLYTHGFACGQDAGKWLFRDQPFVEIKNGIELSQYAYAEESRAFYRQKINANGQKVIGHVGNFFEQKNHEFLIDMFAELIRRNHNYLLVLISDGKLMDHIKAKVHALHLDEYVIFLGKISNVYDYLQAMDIFVLPSLFEGLPLALIEAQASGLPCLVSDTVAAEVNLTHSIEYLSIQNIDSWVTTIERIAAEDLESNRSRRSMLWQKIIREAGYDMKENAEQMGKLYWTYYKEYKGK
ncbi:hypothetical protein BHF69_09625 [Anaerostipes sp. 992a]|uniref:glycosyltransferase family 1 protein n=1 Tax=Anaerostipes sp. 992a TaxID=1261637 RepID=UPI000952DEA1|nr:glycosyltransferase family 1 protein [Anaerostipes sp. 992a]OLR62917.1 hypothetical protein BHF69_09625 [Anaerostipes sp. 992a]